MDLKKNYYNKYLTRFAGLAAGFLILLLALFLSPAVPCSAGTASVSWRVTQYGDDHAGKQSMFYTIKGSNGRLIVVDGGWADQEAFVRKTRDEKSRTFSSNSKRSYILRTSSRSRRLILSSIVSFAVWLKWTRTI